MSPWLIGFLAFTVYPVASAMYYSLCRYDIIGSIRYIGLANYEQMLFHDSKFRIALGNTLYLCAFGVPAGILTAWLLANLLNARIRGRSFFRLLFFIPSIVPVVASAMVWDWIYQPTYGLLNGLLASLGVSPIPWLTSTALAKPSLIIVHMWHQGSTIVIFLAALQDVPRSLYDAALVDGANWWQRFRHVTTPMCTPAVLYALITGLIGMFQYFAFAWLLTDGGPHMATEFYGVYLFRTAFEYFKMGYASALAWVLFIIVVSATMVLFRTSGRWVYYGGGE
ncbi:MAG: sugar ABC transporter permease [Anaerolineae bacterium]|nr:sugar ABC transporter permease [Anaerolineae bacterium]